MAQDIRLYTDNPLNEAVHITLNAEQAHYLNHVLRTKEGDRITLFNGRDGQWQAELVSISKKQIMAQVTKKTREQLNSPDTWLVFAMIKNKSDLVVEKATELGASKIIPIITKHCVVRSVNMEKLNTHAIEAAEQCERLDIPTLETYKDLSYLLGEWDKERTLLYGDETGGGISLRKILCDFNNHKTAILIGPEGGFAEDELAMLRACTFTKAFGMGGRILRADTAAVSALACVQSVLGDWDIRPHFIGNT